MNDISELMKQAKEMQERFQKAQQEQLKQVINGESGAGLVKVSVNGRHEVLSVHLDPSLMQEDKEVVEDLIAAAFNDAARKLEDKKQEAFGAMTGGINLPQGFKLPF
ncbi:MAG: YbaB/EbfC family nucleoid-associated protein [Gammaproteobacteria bacterium]|nr:YbaB/EbfC family nucleoid-associated protein [Gammaproteobacteria bacterium]